MALASTARSAAYGHNGSRRSTPNVRRATRVATNAAPAPAAGARQCVHGRPRHAFSAVAPASTGPATPNDSREASSRE